MRYNIIIENEEYRALLKELETLEESRKYCKHGLEHLLDVARISYIMILEDGADISKDIVYAASLLHDIGRVKTYHQSGEDHDRVSADIAEKILSECGYSPEEIRQICDAILSHRCRRNTGDFIKARESGQKLGLSEYLQISDHISRKCFNCGSSDTCKWKEEERNTYIYI